MVAKLLFTELNKLVNQSHYGAYFIVQKDRKELYMKKDKLILNDGTTIELEAAASLTGLIIIFPDWPAVAAVLPKLTEDNLASVQVQNSEGLSVGNYTDLVPLPGAWVEKADGLYITISLREKTEVEKRLDNMETGQQTQDGAIADMGEVVGKLAEGGVK
jgi:hypothetical protein